MKEEITIKNFGGLKYVTIPLNSINILIGKQASGKSISAKLIYFFKKIFGNIFDSVAEGNLKRKFNEETIKKFRDYFPNECGKDGEFYIQYNLGEDSITIEKNRERQIKIKYSSKINKLFSDSKRFLAKSRNIEEDEVLFHVPFNAVEKYYEHISQTFGTRATNQLFIPAGRSFYANLQSSIFTFLSKNKAIDPFLVEFGDFYERMKNFLDRRSISQNGRNKNNKIIDDLIREILCGKYSRENEKDYIIHEDSRKIDVAFSSSGQQETLPLTVILKSISKLSFIGDGATIYIEEPEAHLFPSAQKKVVELISTVYNISKANLQFIITTHSPYILTSFNTLLQAGLLEQEGVDVKRIHKIIPEYKVIEPNEINAFVMKGGKVESLIEKETGLISATLLDSVSEEIAIQFDKLLSL